jgi:hypothetical protein
LLPPYFLQGIFVWRADHARLEQRISIIQVFKQSWSVHARDATAYYFEVVNKSEALTIRAIRVQLAEISPEVENLNWLPVILHQKHDNAPLPQRAKNFDLNPGEPKHIDLVSAFVQDDHFEIEHIVSGVNREVRGAGHHRLKVMVTAEDMPALFVWFDVWINEAGVLQCKMEDTGKSAV